MKKIFHLYPVLCLAFTGCINDATNKDFKNLNEAIITGIENKYENVYVDQPLVIRPEIKMTQGREEEFSFFWITYDKSTYYNADTLSKEKILNIKVHMKPGAHCMKFKAVHIASGIFYEKEFTVNVINEFSTGLMILSEREGKAMLDFRIPDRNEVITDVYGKLNSGDILGRNPKRIIFNKYRSDETSEVMVLCQDENGGKILDNITLSKRREYREIFFGNIPEKILPQAYYKSSMREYLINDGLAYDRAVNTIVPPATVKPPLTLPGGSYKIAENADFGDKEENVSRMILYDNKNMCFYSLYSITTAFLSKVGKTNGFVYINGGFFHPDNVGMKCLYAGITSRAASGAKEYMGIFETPGGERRLLKMEIGFYVTDAMPASYFKDTDNRPIEEENADKAASFATSALLPGYLLYAAGNKIYLYNSNTSTGAAVYDLGAGHTIDHMEVERNSLCLWIAFRNRNLPDKKAGFCGLAIKTDGGFRLEEIAFHPHIADRIVDFENKY